MATNRNEPDGGWLVSASRRIALTVALAALCFASGAKADGLSCRASALFARHDYMFARRRFLWSKPSAAVHRSPKLISAICINMVWAFPKTMRRPRHELASSGC